MTAAASVALGIDELGFLASVDCASVAAGAHDAGPASASAHAGAPPAPPFAEPPVDELGAPPVDELGAPPVDELGAPPVDELGAPPVDELGAPPVDEVDAALSPPAPVELAFAATCAELELDAPVPLTVEPHATKSPTANSAPMLRAVLT